MSYYVIECIEYCESVKYNCNVDIGGIKIGFGTLIIEEISRGLSFSFSMSSFAQSLNFFFLLFSDTARTLYIMRAQKAAHFCVTFFCYNNNNFFSFIY